MCFGRCVSRTLRVCIRWVGLRWDPLGAGQLQSCQLDLLKTTLGSQVLEGLTPNPIPAGPTCIKWD